MHDPQSKWFWKSEYQKAEAERCRLQRYEKFVQHIESHLGPGQVVICKICGKSVDEIDHDTE